MDWPAASRMQDVRQRVLAHALMLVMVIVLANSGETIVNFHAFPSVLHAPYVCLP